MPTGVHPVEQVIELFEHDIDDGPHPRIGQMYATSGRSSVPPESLWKATILMAMYSIRSQRALYERLNHDSLFKWFLDRVPSTVK